MARIKTHQNASMWHEIDRLEHQTVGELQDYPGDLRALVGVRKDQQVASNDDNPDQPTSMPATTAQAMGLGLAAVTPEVRHAFNLGQDINGVVITKVDPNSDAADKGVQPGDVMVSIANKPVHTPQEVKTRIADAKAAGRSAVLVLLNGQNGQRFVALKIGQA